MTIFLMICLYLSPTNLLQSTNGKNIILFFPSSLFVYKFMETSFD